MKKRADGRYQRQKTIGYKDGRPIKKFFYGKTIRELEESFDEFMDLYRKGVVLEKDATVKMALDEYLENEKKPNIKVQTYKSLKSRTKIISSYIGHIQLRKLSAYDIDRMKKAMIDKGHYDQANQSISMLRRMLDYSVAHNMVARNVANGVSRVKTPNKKVKRALSEDEIYKILNADLNPIEKAFIYVLFYTGIRRGEAIALDVEDVDFVKNVIHVRKTYVMQTNKIQNHTKTKAGMRDVMIPEPLKEYLTDYVELIEEGPLFPSKFNKRISSGSFDKWWTNLSMKIFGDDIPKDFTPHIFRHNYSSDLYKSGIMKDDIKMAQYLLGHDDIKTTLDTYTHFESADVNIKKLNNFYSASQKLVKPEIVEIKKPPKAL